MPCSVRRQPLTEHPAAGADLSPVADGFLFHGSPHSISLNSSGGDRKGSGSELENDTFSGIYTRLIEFEVMGAVRSRSRAANGGVRKP